MNILLKRIGAEFDKQGAAICIKDACFPAPFTSGLEYSAPARGTWNIVHTGMLMPEAHEIFVCAAGCLRGVVLTAAEMNAANRFSTVAIRENNVTDGDMEELIIDGVTDILNKLPVKPRAVMVYTSCVHHFIGCDLKLVYAALREKFPDVDFTDCYMNPIMRKSGLTPDQLMRRQLYSLLREERKDPKRINIIGNDLKTNPDSELVKLIQSSGYELTEIMDCQTYDEYLDMGKASANITYIPAAAASGKALEARLGQKHLNLLDSYNYEEIHANLKTLASYLGVKCPSYIIAREACDKALERAQEVIGHTPIAIDYTMSFRPLGLARLLFDHGFNVDRIYADSFDSVEKEDFLYLQKNSPRIELYATVHAKMRLMPRDAGDGFLALGQKAAYFTGSSHFINMVEGGGLYGYDGIVKLADLMIEAFSTKKEAKELIQNKGLGCECVL